MKNGLIETIEIIDGKEVRSTWCSAILPSKEFITRSIEYNKRKEEERKHKSKNNIIQFLKFLINKE